MTIDEYQHNFFELLSYCPEISSSTEMKYNLFLQGLSPKIHDRVAVGDDMTYEGLVSRCHQAKDSLRRNKSFFSFSRPANSLGPRTQSFKNQGMPSFSSGSGSGGVHHFGKKKGQGQCAICRGRHPAEKCCRSGACFRCGEIGHMKRDCPQATGGSASGSGSHHFVPQRSQGQYIWSTNQRPRVPDRSRFVKRYRLSYMPLDVVLFVSTLTGYLVLAKHLVLGCTLEFEGSELLANIMVLAMEDFDYILGINVLTSYRATVDCYQKIVQFRSVEGDSWFFYGEGARPLMPLVSALRAGQDLEAGREGYLIHVIDTSVGSRPVEELPIVCEYPDFFLGEIPGFPPVREIEFGIELVPERLIV
ncbi:uncharacterized protein [Henckelia pumila]|uniref:uncharacterized protein n=1 Tax=Henckelia pumila TaxID=405737 RepID=UPI003C6DD968